MKSFLSIALVVAISIVGVQSLSCKKCGSGGSDKDVSTCTKGIEDLGQDTECRLPKHEGCLLKYVKNLKSGEISAVKRGCYINNDGWFKFRFVPRPANLPELIEKDDDKYHCEDNGEENGFQNYACFCMTDNCNVVPKALRQAAPADDDDDDDKPGSAVKAAGSLFYSATFFILFWLLK